MEKGEDAERPSRRKTPCRCNRCGGNGGKNCHRRNSRQSKVGSREKRSRRRESARQKFDSSQAQRDRKKGGYREVVVNARVAEPRAEKPRLNFKPKIDKILEALVYLAHKRPGADQYQAVKLFYLSDVEHFNRYGRPITYETYYALDYGPVASTALDLIKQHRLVMKKAGIKSLPIKTEQRDNIIILAEPLRGVDYEVFSKSDLRVLDEMIAEHGNKSFDELYKLTHSHFAYDIAWKNRGDANRSLMYYEDMLGEGSRKAELLEDLEQIAEHMR
jgi:hypothetical protein